MDSKSPRVELLGFISVLTGISVGVLEENLDEVRLGGIANARELAAIREAAVVVARANIFPGMNLHDLKLGEFLGQLGI